MNAMTDRKQTDKGKNRLSYIILEMRPFLHGTLPVRAISLISFFCIVVLSYFSAESHPR